MSDRGLTHLDPLGRARMVDVTPKEPSHRRALARCRVYMQAETTALVARGSVTKGDVLAVARVAGIQAAKRTPDLIPLCHQLTIGECALWEKTGGRSGIWRREPNTNGSGTSSF